jgi:hypothetical protein
VYVKSLPQHQLACSRHPIRTILVFSKQMLPVGLDQRCIAVVCKRPKLADPAFGPIAEEATLTSDVPVPAAEREHRSHGRIAD